MSEVKDESLEYALILLAVMIECTEMIPTRSGPKQETIEHVLERP